MTGTLGKSPLSWLAALLAGVGLVKRGRSPTGGQTPPKPSRKATASKARACIFDGALFEADEVLYFTH